MSASGSRNDRCRVASIGWRGRVQSKVMASAHRVSVLIFVPEHGFGTRRFPMLYYTIVFFVIALIAAFFGFSGIAAGAVSIAKLLFFVFLILAVVSLLLDRKSVV